jgi:uncharacterized protein involved in exopolysaccharide biosynthesis
MQPEEKGGLDLASVLRWLWNHKIALIVASLLGAAIAAVLSLRAPEIFRAETVVIETNKGGLGASSFMNQLGGIAGLAGINLNSGDSSNHDRALLKSRTLSEKFIERNNLLPQLFRGADAKKASMWLGVRRFKAQMLNIREDTRTELITISMRAGDPDKAAAWANDYVALANELARSTAVAEATRNITYLQTEIAKTEVAELQRVLFQLVESESKTLMLANARPEYAFTVIDRAVRPDFRDSPQRAIMTIFGLVAGFLFGVFVIFCRGLLARVRAASP